jgi:hypothetical protein
MNDDIERTLRDSLDRHAGALTSDGEIDDVYRRADHRRARRRSVAVVGSIAIVAAGFIGFATLDSGDGNTDEVALEAATAPPDMPPTTMTIPLSGTGWSCAGYLGSDGYRTYYSDCFQTSWPSGPLAFCATTTVVPSIPVTTIPMTTIPTESNANATVEANACDVGPPAYEPQCFVNTTTTMPVVASTTTSIAVAIGSVPGPQNATAEAVACSTYSAETMPPTSGPPASGPPIDFTNCVTSTTTSTSLPPELTAPNEQQYVVVPGDSIYSIAARFRIDPWVIANYNTWPECVDHPLFVGDVVLIPPGAAIP